MRNVNFFVPAGGEGQRLRPLTETLPKPLLPVAKSAEAKNGYQTIIDTPAKIAASLGSFSLASGCYMGEYLEEHFRGDPSVEVVLDTRLVQIGGSMSQHSERLFANNPDYVVMLPGDHYVKEESVSRLISQLVHADADVALLGTWQKSYHEVYPVEIYSSMECDAIVRHSRKRSPNTISSLGTYAFNAEWLRKRLEEAPKTESGYCDLTTDVVFGNDQSRLPNIVYAPLPEGEYWQDVGTIRRLYEHILWLGVDKDENGNVNLGCDLLDLRRAKGTVVYVGVEDIVELPSNAFVANGFSEIYSN